jgi:hypothetical protein
MGTPEDLLEPTLGHRASPATSIYSAQTGYVVSFLGGPLAGATIALANAYRLKRLRTDWPLALLAIAATVGPMWWWFRGGAHWIAAHAGGDAGAVAFRALGLGFFALVYGWHRQYYRNMAFLGLPPPSGWLMGIAAVVASNAVNLGLAAVLS